MSSEAQSLPIDGALQSFRQQGAAIVARERGLTAPCRIKLAGLARGLGIAEDQIDAAIRSLGANEPEAPPHPQAAKFRERLQKDLAGKKTIIGPTIEAQIVAAASKKYELDEATARQVIAEVAAALGLKRITASEAMNSLAAQIDKAVGDSTWLAREGWDRLRIAGGKWGIELEVVDELIDERLAANRGERTKRRFWTGMTLGGTVGAVALAGLVLFILFVVRSANDDATSPHPAVPPAAAPLAEATVRPASPPPWWDVDLAVDMASARSRWDGLSGASDLMLSPSPNERAAGYERIIERVRAGPIEVELLRTIGNIVAGCHALEPDDSAVQRLRQALLATLPALDAPLPRAGDELELPFWAADTAVAALHRRGATQERRQSLAGALGSNLGADFRLEQPREEQEQLARTRTALAAYQQFAAAAPRQPAAVAGLHGVLWSRVQAWMPPEELARAEASLVAAALPAAENHWPAYESSIVRVLAADDPLYMLKLVDALRRVAGPPELIEHLSALLVIKSGARPKSASKADVIRAVRKAIGSVSPETLTVADRWLTLQDLAAPALAAAEGQTTDTAELLKQTVELAHLTTLAMALAQGDSGLATFDAQIDQPPEWEAPQEPEEDPFKLPSPRRSDSALSPPDQRTFQRYLEFLDNYQRMQRVQREAALRGLANYAVAVPDIQPRQAAQIATYLLAAKSDDELAAIVPALPELRRWKRLRLAVGDELAEAKLAPDKLREVVAALADEEAAEGASADDLRQLLVKTVLRDLAEEAQGTARVSSGDGSVLDKAAVALLECFVLRARLIGVSAADLSAATSPATAIEVSLAPLATPLSGSDASFVANLPHRRRAARYGGENDVRQSVALQRLLVEVSSRRAAKLHPERAAAARQIDAESLAAAAAAKSALVQLRVQEAALLKLWLLYAPEA